MSHKIIALTDTLEINMPTSRPPNYKHLLIVMWEEPTPTEGSEPVWRLRLEDPRTGEKWGFTQVEALTLRLDKILTALKSH